MIEGIKIPNKIWQLTQTPTPCNQLILQIETMANITTASVSATSPTPSAAPQYNNPRRFEADQKNREFLQFMAECETRSKVNPRNVVNIAPGFCFLTVNGDTWSIVHDREAKEWVAYVGNFIEADPKRTKREMVASLLA